MVPSSEGELSWLDHCDSSCKYRQEAGAMSPGLSFYLPLSPSVSVPFLFFSTKILPRAPCLLPVCFGHSPAVAFLLIVEVQRNPLNRSHLPGAEAGTSLYCFSGLSIMSSWLERPSGWPSSNPPTSCVPAATWGAGQAHCVPGHHRCHQARQLQVTLALTEIKGECPEL